MPSAAPAAKLKIRAELRSDRRACRFLLEDFSYAGEPLLFPRAPRAGSALVRSLFALKGVSRVKVAPGAVTVEKEPAEDWHAFARQAAAVLEELARDPGAVSPESAERVPDDAAMRRMVQDALDLQVNPAVAGHGGKILLKDVRDGAVYVQLLGGCHGCASSALTLKGGVERAVREAVPGVDDIIDVTDHASGENPYL